MNADKINRKIPVSIGLLSGSIIAFQLLLMQVLSQSQWNHFAYMVISVALLGFGASGTLLSFVRKQLISRIHRVLPLLMLLCALSMAFLFHKASLVFGGFDAYLIFYEKQHYLNLLVSYLLLFIPFFLGGTAIGLTYSRYAAHIGKLYFADLAGSGAGGLLMLLFFWHVSPATLPFAIALLPLAAGLLLFPRLRKTSATSAQEPVPVTTSASASTSAPEAAKPKAALIVTVVLATTALAALVLILTGLFNPGRLPASEYKSLSRTLLLPNARITDTKYSPFGELTRVNAPAQRYAPGLSLNYYGTVPESDMLFNNGDWFGPLLPFQTGEEVRFMEYTTYALPYVLQNPRRVFIAHAGAGHFTSQALQQGATNILAVEPHKAAADLLRKELGFPQDKVRFVSGTPRYYLQRSRTPFDLMVLPQVGSFGGGGGMSALEEQYLFTTEAFSLMWNKLSHEGMVTATVWMDHPPRNSLKMAATLVQVVKHQGIENPATHILAVRSWSTLTFVLKKGEVTKAEVEALRKFCESRQFDLVLYPGIRAWERERFNALEDSSFFTILDTLFAPAGEIRGKESALRKPSTSQSQNTLRNQSSLLKPSTSQSQNTSHNQSSLHIPNASHKKNALYKQSALFRQYDFNIKPARDSRPFFSQFLKLSRLRKIRDSFGIASTPFFEVGYLIVWLTLAQVLLLAFVLILVPLFFKQIPGRTKWPPLLYFAAIGTGYMFAEILFIQQFSQYFGSTLYAASVVLGAMLLFSGAGAAFSQRILRSGERMKVLAIAIAVVLSLLAPGLPVVLNATTGAPFVVKGLLCVFLIGPVAFLMGMMFPCGIRVLSLGGEEEMIPWAWGVNGTFSVISTALATIVAVEVGYPFVLWGAGFAYLIAGLVCKSRVFSKFVS